MPKHTKGCHGTAWSQKLLAVCVNWELFLRNSCKCERYYLGSILESLILETPTLTWISGCAGAPVLDLSDYPMILGTPWAL